MLIGPPNKRALSLDSTHYFTSDKNRPYISATPMDGCPNPPRLARCDRHGVEVDTQWCRRRDGVRPPSVRQHAMPYMLANAASDSRVKLHIEHPDVESRY